MKRLFLLFLLLSAFLRAEVLPIPPAAFRPYGQVTALDTPGHFRVAAAADARAWDSGLLWPLPRGLREGELLGVEITFRFRDFRDAETGEQRLLLAVERNRVPHEKIITAAPSAGERPVNWNAAATVSRDLPAGEGQLVLHLGGLDAVLEIHSATLTVLPPGTDPATLPRTRLRWQGMEADAPWRTRAEADIRLHRTGDLVIETGAPNQPVRARMTRHAFAFGSAVSGPVFMRPEAETYRRRLRENFEWVTPENDLKWQAEDWNWPVDPGRLVDDLRGEGFIVRGHVLLWPSFRQSPRRLQDLDNAALAAAIEARVRETARTFRGRIPEWDVLNEVYSNHDFPDRLGRDILHQALRWAREEAPDARLFVNDYAILAEPRLHTAHKDAYHALIRELRADGAPLDGIGLQGHFGANVPGIEEMRATLDRFAEFGLPLRVTEFDHDIDDEEAQALLLRDVLTLCFAHPAVDGVILWGFWDGAHWKQNAPLFRRDWTPKPAHTVWRELVWTRWRTPDFEDRTDAAGRIVIPGAFFGDYEWAVEGGPAGKAVHGP